VSLEAAKLDPAPSSCERIEIELPGEVRVRLEGQSMKRA
jgi:hypothetical protein